MARSIKVEILGDARKLNQAFKDAGSATTSFATNLGKASLVMSAAGGAAAAGVTAGLYKIGSSFDDAYDKIRIKVGATGDRLNQLETSFKKVATSVPASFDDVSSAIAGLSQRLEISGTDLEDLATQFLNLSRITGTDVTGNVDLLTRVFGDWSVATRDQAKALDELYRASQASGINIQDLSGMLVQFGAPFRNLGFSFEQSAAILALWNKAGVNTETVISGLKKSIGTLAKAGEDVPTTFRRIVAEIARLGPGTQATQKAIALFGMKAGPDMADAITGGKFAIDDMLNAITGGEDTINGAAQATADFAEHWQKLKNTAMVALEPLAGAVFGFLGEHIQKVQPLIKGLTGAFTAFGDGWKSTGDNVTRSGFYGFLERLGRLLANLILPVFRDVKQGFESFVAAWKYNTGAVFATGFAGWMEGLAYTIRNSLIPTLQHIGERVLPIVRTALQDAWLIIQGLVQFLNEHREVLIAIGVVFMAWAVSAGLAALSTLAAAAPVIALTVAVTALVAWLIHAYQHNERFREIADKVGRVLRDDVLPVVKTVAVWIATSFVPAVAKLLALLGELAVLVAYVIVKIVEVVAKVAIKILSYGDDIFNALIWPFKKAFEFIKMGWDAIASIPDKISSLAHPTRFLPHLATGGQQVAAGGGWAVVGERGPEQVWLPQGAHVTPSWSSNKPGGDTYNIYGPNLTAPEMARELAWARRRGDGR